MYQNGFSLYNFKRTFFLGNTRMPRDRDLEFDLDSGEMEKDLDVEDGDLPGSPAVLFT